jgi:NADH-quinone oxidoreductase subunit J
VIPLLAQTAAVPATGGGAGEFWVFLVVGAISLGSAISMVVLRNAVHAALMLVINLLTIAVLYAVLEAQFLAVTQIIVYAGAIMVLFLFVIMLLGIHRDEPRDAKVGPHKVAAVLIGVLLFGGIATSVAAPFMGPASVCGPGQQPGAGVVCAGLAEQNADGNTQGIGRRLFTDYVWPFEVTSVLLVIAAVGAMVVGRRGEDPTDLTEGGTPVDEPARAQAGESPMERRSPTRTRSPGERP